ncbi:MAG: class I SAM-dependent methyltransferase [Bryobacteraceae bacterium]|nr:class I SAM-dependent methyltransferase [Bryobacteraceae bacterium]MDW8379071.1 class I SAM-dependent methyltransferase [Bryobacterales bacterium]
MHFGWFGDGGAVVWSEQDVHTTSCPACGFHVGILFYDGGRQPLATLGWPRSAAEARAMPKLPLRFVRCLDCGHIFNAAFDYAAVPYGDQPNRMYNQGLRWSEFLRRVAREIIRRLPANSVVVEIGHGDGSFLELLARMQPSSRFYGFDPHGATESSLENVNYRRALFVPAKHMAELRPDLLISRHVLEHLADPLGFVQSLSFAAAAAGLNPVLYLEVPCIDRALATNRTEDFYYEHNSHFTTESFSRMLARGFCSIDALDHGYDGEVVYAFLRLKGKLEHLHQARQAKAFQRMAQASRQAMMMELAQHYMSGRKVAFWGGTGKCAAFLQAHHVDAHRFPLVVDSDPSKIGSYVPGTGQLIQPAAVLVKQRPDVLVIPTQWRARDIVEEMARLGIQAGQVVIPHEGRLVDFLRGHHPYQRPLASPNSPNGAPQPDLGQERLGEVLAR